MLLDRRGFLGSLSSFIHQKNNPPLPVRLPGSGSGTDFSPCRECEAPCIEKCEEGIIVLGDDAVPFIDFSKGGCTYCGECIAICPKGVLEADESKRRIEAAIEINPLKCLAWNQTICSLCKDPCLDKAIEFLGLFRPQVLTDRCTACGFCVRVCPTAAVEVKTRQG